LFDDNIPSHSCPNCGSTHLVKRGIAITEAARWQRYSCGDCGKWSRGEKIKKNIKYSKTDHINKK
jgi:transposase-like protein